MPEQDHAFKELLREFFPEFIDLFFSQMAVYLDRHSLEFQPQEIFADLTEGNTDEADVVVKAKFLTPSPSLRGRRNRIFISQFSNAEFPI